MKTMPALEEARSKRDRLARELEAQRRAPSASKEKVAGIESGLAELDNTIVDLEARSEQIRRAVELGHVESGDGPAAGHSERKSTMSNKYKIRGEGISEHHDSALRAIDAAYERSEIGEAAGKRAMSAVTRDKFGADARYLSAVSSEAYRSAFAKRIGAANGAEASLTAAESEAMQKVGQAMAERSMLAGEGSSGGFALPVSVDPSIQISSDGSLNPVRQFATVTPITTSEWRGLSSEGVVAEFAAEGSEVKDGSPTLAQPKAKAEKAHAFVQFSIELGQDWASLAPELAKLFSDAKDNAEAAAFLTGDGEDEPSGLLHEVAEGSVVETISAEAFAAGDVYATQEALPPRFQPRARWLSSLAIANVIHRLHNPSGEEAALFNEDRSALLSKPWAEVANMSTDTEEAGEDLLVYGDIASGFRIADRIGMSVEPIPHVFGEEGRPTGERGLYCFWRVGSVVQVPNAIRVLRVKAE